MPYYNQNGGPPYQNPSYNSYGSGPGNDWGDSLNHSYSNPPGSGNVYNINNRIIIQNHTNSHNNNNRRRPVRRVRRGFLSLGINFNPEESQVKEAEEQPDEKDRQADAENHRIRPIDLVTSATTQVELRIGTGTGGTDQTGLLNKLTEAYIQYCTTTKNEQPFVVVFYASDSSSTYDLLKSDVIDIGVTDNAFADMEAISQRVAGKVGTAWYDHYLLVGPTDNPAGLPTDSSMGASQLFANLCIRLQASMDAEKPIKYLSRYDGSACSLKEAYFWTQLGQAPWTDNEASWFVMSRLDAAATLATAAEMGAYALTDRTTWHTVDEEIREKFTIFHTTEPGEVDPTLIKEMHLLVGSKVRNQSRALDFFEWVLRADGGHSIITSFQLNGDVIFTSPAIEEKPTQKSAVEPAKNFPSKPAVARAAVNFFGASNEIYFFEGSKYVRIDCVRDTISYGTAKDIAPMWPSLHSAGIQTVDAILPINKTDKNVIIFSGDDMLVIDLNSGQAQANVCKWADQFPPLKEAAFPYIDAIIPHFWPDAQPHLYTFVCGPMCLTIDGDTGKAVGSLKPLPTSLTGLGFHELDTFVFKPGTNFEEGYFFSKGHYVCLRLEDMQVPKLLVQKEWSSLSKAGFCSMEHEEVVVYGSRRDVFKGVRGGRDLPTWWW